MPPRRHGARRQAGFTMAELIIVLVVAGVLAAVAIPKMSGLLDMRNDAWRDQLVAGLRYAQKSAVGHRRVVCATIGTTTLTLTLATANPASSCDASLPGPDGSSVYATSGNSASATSVSPGGTLYFQPSGRVTTDLAGSSAANRTVSMTGAGSVTVYGETGYVE